MAALLLDFENTYSVKEEYRFQYTDRNNPSYFTSMTL